MVESERSQGIWKVRRQVSWIHVKENSKKIWIFVHIPIYAVLVVKPTYICAYKFKSHVYHFHMFLGMVKETSKDKKWSMGSKESSVGQGKAIQSVIHLEW